MQEIGGASIALSTLSITMYTFSCLFLRWTPPNSKIVPITVVACIWLYSVLFVAIGYSTYPKLPTGGKLPFYAPAPYWCYIQDSPNLRVFAEYLWIWIALVTSVVLYVPLFFLLQGWIAVDIVKSRHGITYPRVSQSCSADLPRNSFIRGHAQQLANVEARRMLYYPCAYSLTVIPQIVVRWSKSTPDIPVAERSFSASGTAIFLFSLSGFVNVLLFWRTRPSMLGLDHRQGGGVGPLTSVSTVIVSCPECQRPGSRHARQVSSSSISKASPKQDNGTGDPYVVELAPRGAERAALDHATTLEGPLRMSDGSGSEHSHLRVHVAPPCHGHVASFPGSLSPSDAVSV